MYPAVALAEALSNTWKKTRPLWARFPQHAVRELKNLQVFRLNVVRSKTQNGVRLCVSRSGDGGFLRGLLGLDGRAVGASLPGVRDSPWRIADSGVKGKRFAKSSSKATFLRSAVLLC